MPGSNEARSAEQTTVIRTMIGQLWEALLREGPSDTRRLRWPIASNYVVLKSNRPSAHAKRPYLVFLAPFVLRGREALEPVLIRVRGTMAAAAMFAGIVGL